MGGVVRIKYSLFGFFIFFLPFVSDMYDCRYIIMCSLTFKLMNIAIVIMPSASNKHGWLYYHSVKVLDMIGLKLSALNQIKLSSRA
ncbi:unnamed protein product [Trifolium pratense]|uniref:Uncharacterized protein n=1 Tax=Trifolium pratense TaxID=57577 RepID=A0ACB0KUD7_TRIPR|nr:unnamed protein product [Trifolium pratense]